MMRKVISILILLLLTQAPVYAQFGDLLKKIGVDKKDDLDDGTIVSGLKEALQIGTQNTVDITGQVDGYFRNEAIKILLPDKLKSMDKGLRLVGYGDAMDEFVLSMNRAAEAAAPRAKAIFWDSIKQMTFQDARQILTGGDTAATEFFRETAGEELAEAFHPVVSETMNEVGVTRQYKELTGRLGSIPFMKTEAFDLDSYVVEKALDGLFHVLGEEERKIRKNPAARVTDLLQRVFG